MPLPEPPERIREDRLWYPGCEDLDKEYPIPTDQELLMYWQGYTEQEAQSLKGAFGVYSQPPDELSAVVSIDVCEIFRDTSIAMSDVVGLPLKRGQYGQDTWYSIPTMGRAYEGSLVLGVVQAVMNADMVPTIEGIDKLAEIIRTWRDNGVYTVANTSTLPGCELATIRMFEKELKECFDALVLPRNPHGNEGITKAGALGILADEVGIDLDDFPLIHIDDATHHIKGFADQFADHGASAYFMPAHAYSRPIAPEIDCETPLEAFTRANEFLRKQGVNV
jgi:hypothetical protein